MVRGFGGVAIASFKLSGEILKKGRNTDGTKHEVTKDAKGHEDVLRARGFGWVTEGGVVS